MSINLGELPRETRDKLILKEDTEPTFGNALSEDYSEELFKTLEERRNKNIQHSYIGTWYGTQGSGKSYAALACSGILDPDFNIDKIFFDIEVLVNNRNKIREHSCILLDEMARPFGLDSMRISIQLNTMKEQLRKKSVHMFYASPTLKEEHHTCLLEDTIINVKNKGYINVNCVNNGDYILNDEGKYIKVNKKWNVKKRKCYKLKTDFGGEVVASGQHRFLCDNELKNVYNIKKGNFIRISHPILRKGNKKDYYKGFFYGSFLADGHINESLISRISKYTGKRVKSGKSFFLSIYNNDYSIRKYLKNIAERFFSFTSSKMVKSKDITKRCNNIVFYGKNQVLDIKKILGSNIRNKKIHQFSTLQEALGILNGYANCDSAWSLQKSTSGIRKKYSVSFNILSKSIAYGLSDILHCFGVFPIIRKQKRNFVLYIPSLQVKKFFSLLDIHNNKKNINFKKIKKLIEKKVFLPGNYKSIEKEGFCKVLDIRYIGIKDCIDLEVSSNNHLFQLAGGIISHNSMYVLETMFIDKKNKLSFHAYKTNQLLTLGYVVIPHPLHFISKKTLINYERKKDIHLKEVLEGPKDLVEERAQQIIRNSFFIKAEKMYYKARGYIPYKILVQIVEKIYPEFKGSVIVYELADRIKADKEISGDWLIFGSKKE